MKPQPKHIVFRVIHQIKVPIDISLDNQRKYPVHEHYLTEFKERVFVYKYRADSSLDEKAYIAFWKKKLKRKYNAYSVVLGTLQEQLM